MFGSYFCFHTNGFKQERLGVKTCLKWSSTEVQLSHLLVGDDSSCWLNQESSPNENHNQQKGGCCAEETKEQQTGNVLMKPSVSERTTDIFLLLSG